MDAFVIQGRRKLEGRVEVSGAKNAALPVMAATLLTPAVHTLRNVPLLSDTRTMARVLETLGARVEFRGNTCRIDTSNVSSLEAPYDLVRTMRASIYVLGPLLARFGAARVSLPGGCAWGPRPVNLHLDGLNAMGAALEIEHGYIVGKDVKLKGASYTFENVSVGATAQLMMAAVLANGDTTIDNAAIEPDITQLGEVLTQCGANIEGVGTRRMVIHGVKHLTPIDTTIIPDRIEAATFLAAAAITGGTLTVERCEPAHMAAAIHKFEQAGCEVLPGSREITIRGPVRLGAVDVTTAPFPGFPTDVQAQMMSVMAMADGTSVMTDTVYLDRFTHVPELQRLGADIKLDHNVAVIRGVDRLQGCPVMATDIRASAALVLAALAAEGETRISRIYHLDRGHEKFDERLKKLGAEIERVKE
ncbi:MAG: UDP-N-acetylglucosamine 1-carboxyvinyltransferase [Candidatus Eisenbacteria bacterium]|uniref:UDP-N-acetylglucosamine 1-carboxyvinyltransferase n=1 Tax=Eiseniibacteriota bacterium TaxID=2212470 RepID=A0A849ST61_UNCEI|nr:UDP-N-acetylglucosamine 1-carboxyvinyltransferase [Candidatus Eisenbacteria bacterium]